MALFESLSANAMRRCVHSRAWRSREHGRGMDTANSLPLSGLVAVISPPWSRAISALQGSLSMLRCTARGLLTQFKIDRYREDNGERDQHQLATVISSPFGGTARGPPRFASTRAIMEAVICGGVPSGAPDRKDFWSTL